MTKEVMAAYGVIINYSFDSDTLTIMVSFRIKDAEKLIFYNVSTYGTEYEMLCNQLYLYGKDGMINLNFLPETYVTADIIEEAGEYKVENLKLDVLRYL